MAGSWCFAVEGLRSKEGCRTAPANIRRKNGQGEYILVIKQIDKATRDKMTAREEVKKKSHSTKNMKIVKFGVSLCGKIVQVFLSLFGFHLDFIFT